VGNNPSTNNAGDSYVAYLFAHNAGGFGPTGTDNVISCGSFTTDSSGNATVNLGYEPQWLLTKTTGISSPWRIVDTMRGFAVANDQDAILEPNTSNAEASTQNLANPTATGFDVTNVNANATFIYVAIRRGPMKVPTTGTSVYEPVTYAGNDANRIITAGFPVDSSIFALRDTATSGKMAVTDRLRGRNQLFTSQNGAESTASGLQSNPWDLMTGVKVSGDSGVTNYTPWNYVVWNLRRAPSFFDEVCYTGTGSARTVAHNLAAVPELMIVKNRGGAAQWVVYSASLGNTKYLSLNLTDAEAVFSAAWDNINQSEIISMKLNGTLQAPFFWVPSNLAMSI
jgi:hypothetical protein